MTTYRWLFDHLLVHVDPEHAHELGFRALRLAPPGLTSRVARSSDFVERSLTTRRHGAADSAMAVNALGMTFPGPLGLAAGFDKNAEGIDALTGLGFSFVEVGTVTAQAQPGNPRPRLFRLPKDRAIMNRMGFNNEGAEAVAQRLARREQRMRRHPGRAHVPLGINIGKTKVVPDDPAEGVVADYETSTRLLAPYADYLVVNVSSPNTPGLRDLQAVARLGPLLVAVRRQADAVTEERVPLLVKIAPDLSDAGVLAVADLAVALDLDGIVATNTTVARDDLASSAQEIERAGSGGLSGAPLRRRSLEVLRLLRERVGEDMVIICVGGISTAHDAWERLEAGATLLQAYTAFVYEGAFWPSTLQRDLVRLRAHSREGEVR
ncbi:MAG TPA: quinone-dependent dihydroorotate dehydrogenase [Nocardioidaceae bacterium]|nr:quinone-dependent dihydroorotate dehydrogenase [Nocardioidaceae bacterium]